MGKRKLIGTMFYTYTLVKTNRKSLNRTLLCWNCFWDGLVKLHFLLALAKLEAVHQ